MILTMDVASSNKFFLLWINLIYPFKHTWGDTSSCNGAEGHSLVPLDILFLLPLSDHLSISIWKNFYSHNKSYLSHSMEFLFFDSSGFSCGNIGRAYCEKHARESWRQTIVLFAGFDMVSLWNILQENVIIKWYRNSFI